MQLINKNLFYLKNFPFLNLKKYFSTISGNSTEINLNILETKNKIEEINNEKQSLIKNNKRFFFLKKLKKREEKKLIQISRLKKQLIRKWKLKRIKSSSINLKFKETVLLKIVNKIRKIHKSKNKLRLKSNLVSKLVRIIHFYQIYESKKYNKIENLLHNYHNLLLLTEKNKIVNETIHLFNIDKKLKNISNIDNKINKIVLSLFKSSPSLKSKLLEPENDKNKIIENRKINNKILLIDNYYLSKKESLSILDNSNNNGKLRLPVINQSSMTNFKLSHSYNSIREKFKQNIKIKNFTSSSKLSIIIYIQYIKNWMTQLNSNNTTKLTHYYKNWLGSEKNIFKNITEFNKNKGLLYYHLLKGFIGRSSNYHNQLLFHTKSVSYNFYKINNLYNLFGSSDKINKLIKELFFTVSSLISLPVFIFKQNKLTIRLFLYLAPKLNFKLRSGLINKRKKFKKHIWKKMKHLMKGKNQLFSEEFKKVYLKNLTQFNLMNYNSGFKYFMHLNQIPLKNNFNLIGFTHTGNPLLNIKLTNKSENYKSIVRKRDKSKLLKKYNSLIIRNKYVSINFEKYSDFIKTIYSQIFLAKTKNKNLNYNRLRPFLVKPFTFKKYDLKRINWKNQKKYDIFLSPNYILYNKSIFNRNLNQISYNKNLNKKINFNSKLFRLYNKLPYLQIRNKMLSYKFKNSVLKSIKYANRYFGQIGYKKYKKSKLNLFLLNKWPLNQSGILMFINYLNKEEKNIKNIHFKNHLIYWNSLQKKDNMILNKFKNRNKFKQKNRKIKNRRYRQAVSFFTLFKTKLKLIATVLSKILNIPVEFEIVKLEIPFQETTMVSQILGYSSKKSYFYKMWRRLLPKIGISNPTPNMTYLLEKKEEEIERKEKSFLYESSSYLPSLFNINKLNSKFLGFKSIANNTSGISSYASGINMKLAGRLMTQRMRPRFTVQVKQNGSLARVKVDFVEKSRFTGKNKRGAFSFSVSIGHIIK